MAQILVISAELLQRTHLGDILGRGGYEVVAVPDVVAAIEQEVAGTDCVVINPVQPGASPEEVLRAASRRWPSACLLLLHNPDNPASLLGLCDDFVDPDLSEAFLLHRVERALELAAFMGRPVDTEERDLILYLLPRSRFLVLAQWELARSRRYGGNAVLIRTAIDYFEKLRDLVGHRLADELRRSYAQVLLGVVRASDLVATWGDDGFAILLPEARRADALGFLSKVAQQIEREAAVSECWREQTVSFGLCFSPADTSVDAQAWVEWTESALRAAQREARGEIRELSFQLGEGRVVEVDPVDPSAGVGEPRSGR